MTQRPLIRNAADREAVRRWLTSEIYTYESRQQLSRDPEDCWDGEIVAMRYARRRLCGLCPAPKKKPAASGGKRKAT